MLTNIDWGDLKKAIILHYDVSEVGAEIWANHLIVSLSQDFERNVAEWIQNKPLTDINYRERYSVDFVMRLRKSDVLSAMECINSYLNDHLNARKHIWR